MYKTDWIQKLPICNKTLRNVNFCNNFFCFIHFSLKFSQKMPIYILKKQRENKGQRKMGLACAQISLLMLTSRKADCELNIAIDSRRKMSLTMEQSNLSREYQAKLQTKNLAYYANGHYNQIDYGYLMGYGINTISSASQRPLKKDNSIVLTDYNGLVVMNKSYTSALLKVLGSSAMDSSGRGSTFSKDKIPAIIAEISGLPEEDIQKVIGGEDIPSSYDSTTVNTMSLEETGSTVTDNSDKVTAGIQKWIDFFYPIFIAAAANGWTSEYNNAMATNSNYINDALVSGSFQLAQVDEFGGYDPDTSLTYFTMNGTVEARTDSDIRAEITAWYNAEKERISAKEDMLDLEIRDYSTELEAINTEMESVKSFIQDQMKVFNWCGNG